MDGAVLAEQVDWLTRDALGNKGQSMVIGVYSGGEQVHLATAGELVSGDVPNVQTPYRAGSVSKLFTALSVMQLHEEGHLDIDAALADQLPGFAIHSRIEGADAITPRHVLTHHASLPCDWFEDWLTDDAERFTILAGRMNAEWTSHPPGEWWSYSNVGFSLLGHLVEEASGMAFEDYVQTTIFDPCGMSASSWEMSTSVVGAIEGEVAYEGNDMLERPAGSLVTTVEDLARFADMLLQGGDCPGGSVVAAETTTRTIL